MTIENDDREKVVRNITTKISILVTVQTTTHMMRGRLHVRRDQRLKDELDMNENFLALTDVQVLGPDGQALFHSPFVAVRREHIIWVLPEQKPEDEITPDRTYGRVD